MNTIKKLIAAGLIGSIALSLSAQTDPPDASVDGEGNLVIGDLVIPPPEGTVDGEGNLVIGDTTIPAPSATVNEDGSITVGDQTFEVPALPNGGDFIVSWFGDELFDFANSPGPDQNQWYFSYRFKSLYHFAENNWFYSLELDATLYIRPDSGNRSLEEGIMMYTSNLFNGQTEGTWIFVAGKNGFGTLEDTNSDGQLGDEQVDGFIYVYNPTGYPTTEPGFFYFGEFDTGDNPGNYIWRVGDLANAQKLRDPA